jgi:cytochrome P450
MNPSSTTDEGVQDAYDPMSPDAKQDPERYWSALRPVQPVHHFTLPADVAAVMSANPLAAKPTKDFFSVLRYADLRDVLMNPKMFSSTEGPGPERMIPMSEGGVLLFADDPVHIRQRRLAAKAFTPSSVSQLIPQIQNTADNLIDAVSALGAMEIMRDFALPLSIRTIAAIVGVPMDRVDDFRRWGNGIVAAFGGEPDALNEGFVALQELFNYMPTLIDAIRSDTADAISPDLAGGVLAGLVHAEVEGTRLTDNEILHMVMQLVTAGFETTSTATANGVHLLCTHPEQRALYAGGDAECQRFAVEEIVRFASPLEGLFRTCNEDVTISGCPIPKGSKIRAVFASANRDDAQFADAGEFRIDRDPAELRKHLGFGLGPHACIGAALARAELQIVFKTLFTRLPGLELDTSRPPVRSTVLTINGFKELHIRWDPAQAQSRAAARQEKGDSA